MHTATQKAFELSTELRCKSCLDEHRDEISRLRALNRELVEALERREASDEAKHEFIDLECFVDDPETRDNYWEEYVLRRDACTALAKAKEG